MHSKYDMTGRRFGNLVVIELIGVDKNHHTTYLCKCDCGAIKKTNQSDLNSGKVLSCGCRRRRVSADRHATHHESKSRLYRIWGAVKTRCHNPNSKEFDRYMGRGITLCPEWDKSYEAFRDWSKANGYSDKLTIERIDNDKGYAPDNCRWATSKEQAENTSRNIVIMDGENRLLARDVALLLNIQHHTVTKWYKKYGFSTLEQCIERYDLIKGGYSHSVLRQQPPESVQLDERLVKLLKIGDTQ